MKTLKTISILAILSSIFLCSCQGDNRDFSSYEPRTSFCTSELSKNNSGMNKICNLNKVKNSFGNEVRPFNSDLIYALFPYQTLTLENVYIIEELMGEKMINLHKYFDRHNSYKDENGNTISNLKTINDSYGTGNKIKVDKELFTILKLSLELGEISSGRFNIAIGELSDYWNGLIDYNRDNYGLLDPDLVIINNPSLDENEKIALEQETKDKLKTELDQLVKDTPSIKELKEILVLDEENLTVEFKKYKDAETVSLSLGGIGKGYGVNIISDILLQNGFNNGYISGATSSNVILGNHYKNSSWSIAISSPSKYDYISGGTLSLNGYNVISTSGDEVNSYAFYNENLEVIRRHHIIDATTGYPQYNFRKVTIVSKTLNSAIMDALSTILVNTPLKEMKEFLPYLRAYFNADIEAIFQDSNADNTEYYYYITKGLKDHFKVNEDNPVKASVTYYEF